MENSSHASPQESPSAQLFAKSCFSVATPTGLLPAGGGHFSSDCIGYTAAFISFVAAGHRELRENFNGGIYGNDESNDSSRWTKYGRRRIYWRTATVDRGCGNGGGRLAHRQVACSAGGAKIPVRRRRQFQECMLGGRLGPKQLAIQAADDWPSGRHEKFGEPSACRALQLLRSENGEKFPNQRQRHRA